MNCNARDSKQRTYATTRNSSTPTSGISRKSRLRTAKRLMTFFQAEFTEETDSLRTIDNIKRKQ